MGWHVVLGSIICIILGPLIPEDFKGLSCCCLLQTVSLHVPRLAVLNVQRCMDKGIDRLIVHLDLGWLLQMSDDFEEIAEAHSGLASVEKCSTLCFCHRTDNMFE
eukprot:4973220-Ditylum_brightwellii.AAC.1